MLRRRRVTQYDEAGPPPRPLIWPWLVLLLALVIGGLLLGYFLTRDDGGSSNPRVPDVVGLSTAVAVQRLGQRGYPAVVEGRVSEGTQLGTVLSQDPAAGTELDRSNQVTIVVARGPSTVDVPNVVGLAADQAFERLQAAKLKGRSERIASAQPRGRVVQQAPPGGSQAEKGSTVTLLVSKGAKLVRVPPVVGLTEAAATATLSRLGFRLSVSRVSSTEAKGIVISQQPPARSRAQKGSIVGINVSKGPSGTTTTTTTGPPAATGSAQTAVVPKVVGLSQRAALARIEAAGLKTDSFPVKSSMTRGLVVKQLPVGRSKVPRGSVVRIDVSLGPGSRPSRVVPDVTGKTEKQARRLLVNAGFTVLTVDQPTTVLNEQGIVLQQRPAAGNRSRTGAQIKIFVGRTPSPSD